MTFAADNAPTRLAMVRAAERLFAERGVDLVTLDDLDGKLGLAAGSVATCFGTKADLLDAIFMRHSVGINSDWMVALDQLQSAHRQSGTEASLADLARVLVLGIVNKIDDPDGGRDYLRIAAQLAIHREFPLTERRGVMGPGVLRLFGDIAAITQRPPELLRYRVPRISATIQQSIAVYLNLSGGVPGADRALFVEDLIDCIGGMIQARPSSETLRLLGNP